MSRLKQTQNIDKLILNIQFVIKNQCSLSVDDLGILNESLMVLKGLKGKKGKTNEQILTEIVKIVELFTKFLM